MNIISWSELRSLSATETLKILPVTITVNGFAVMGLDKIEDIMITSDLHPNVKMQLKAREQMARAGMPPTKKIFACEVKEPVGE